jgi:hypothetical protein
MNETHSKLLIMEIWELDTTMNSISFFSKSPELLSGQPAVYIVSVIEAKAVPLHAMESLGGRGGIAPTHS